MSVTSCTVMYILVIRGTVSNSSKSSSLSCLFDIEEKYSLKASAVSVSNFDHIISSSIKDGIDP